MAAEWQAPAGAGLICCGIDRAPRLWEPEPCEREPFAGRQDRDPGRDACRGGRSSRWHVRRLQLGGCSRLAVPERPRRGASLEVRPSASGLQPTVREVMLFRGLDLLDHSSLGRGLRRLSGDGAKRKRRTNASTAAIFMSIDVFILLSFGPALTAHGAYCYL
jgi:hypothetical protein